MIKKISVKVKKLHPEAKIPSYGTDFSAGFDLYSVDDYELKPGETKAIGTGIVLEIPEGKGLFIWDRSGLGSKGIHRFAGLLDSDYRGECKIVLHNHTNQQFLIEKGMRIAQAVIQDYHKAEFREVHELSDTKRGAGGFGSTGMK